MVCQYIRTYNFIHPWQTLPRLLTRDKRRVYYVQCRMLIYEGDIFILLRRYFTHNFLEWQWAYMICGLGTDIVEISRIKKSLERFGMRFVKKILTEEELAQLMPTEKASFSHAAVCPSAHIPAHRLAARFAAKEAAVKALGTGFTNGISLQHIAVLNLPSGQPQLHLYGPALEVLQNLGATQSHISISHGRDSACAVVILEK